MTAHPVRPSITDKPFLIIDNADRPATARVLRDHLASMGILFERAGNVVALHRDNCTGELVVRVLTQESVIREAHRIVRPMVWRTARNGELEFVPTTLPKMVAAQYLDMVGDWALPPLNGICAATIKVRERVNQDENAPGMG